MPKPYSKLKAYLELFRLPNVFTAVADVMMGFLLTHPQFQPASVYTLLIAISCLMYIAGMILNDVYDRKVDAQERPHRPIPSGRIHPGFARMMGVEMLLLGVALGGVISFSLGDARIVWVAAALALTVYLYDRVLKQTPAGPLAMGGCRFLNVLLGMSAATFEGEPAAWHSIHFLVAGGIGVYIVGVTWFARTEARTSNRLHLAGSTLIMMIGLAMLAFFPQVFDADLPRLSIINPKHIPPERWILFWIVIGLLIGWRCFRAVLRPEPALVQAAVKQCIISLIVLDAACVAMVRGPLEALYVIMLVVPMMTLGRWIYST